MKFLLCLMLVYVVVAMTSAMNVHRELRQAEDSEEESVVEFEVESEVESEVELSDLSEVKLSDLSEVELSDLSEVKLSDLSEVELSEVEGNEANEVGVDPTEEAEFESESELESELESESEVPEAISLNGSPLSSVDPVQPSDSALDTESSEENMDGNAIVAGGDSSAESTGDMSNVGVVVISSEEDGTNVINEPLATTSTVGYGISTDNPLLEPTTDLKFINRGDVFIAPSGPNEGIQNKLGSEPLEGESSSSAQTIGLIVGGVSAGAIAVAAGAAIAYTKLKAGSVAGAA